jgi:5-hydroxyisourate hydrolase-like protein (transthyretin family)
MTDHELLDPGPLDPELHDLLAAERQRPNPPAAAEQRVGDRLGRTLGWSGATAGAGVGSGAGLFASRAVLLSVLAVGSLAVLGGLAALRGRETGATSGAGSATAPRASSVLPAMARRFSGESPLRLVSGTAVIDPRHGHGRFEGRVVSSETGLPIAGAELVFAHDGSTHAVTSTAEGRFSFDAPETGTYVLARASAERHLDFSPPWEQSEVELIARADRTLQGVEIQLAPQTQWIGVVRDASRRPVAGANVQLLQPEPGRDSRVSTDADGEFRMVLRPGDTILASHPTLGSGETRVLFLPHQTPRVSVDLTQGPAAAHPAKAASEDASEDRSANGNAGHLHGHVRDAAKGTPVAAFSVVVWARAGALSREVVARRSFFDAEGEFDVRGLPPGEYFITVVADGFASSPPKTAVVGETNSAHDLRLERGARVLGTVVDVDTHAPIAGARVSLERDLSGGDEPIRLIGVTETNAEGRFELGGLSAGLRSIMVTHGRHHGRILSNLEVRANGDVGPVEVALTGTKVGEAPRLELTGIGAALKARGDVLIVDKVVEFGGASEAGLVVGDAILAIDGVKTSELDFEQAVQRIRGAEGSTVTLRVQKGEGAPAEDRQVRRRRVQVR